MSTDPASIQIRVKTQYLPEQSQPQHHKYVFAYTITISNRGTAAAQLMGRRWRITDTHGQVQEVTGAGVVGETPWIEPGAAYTYTSGAVLDTPSGSMEGAYQMVDSAGEGFEVPIPAFNLLPPNMLH